MAAIAKPKPGNIDRNTTFWAIWNRANYTAVKRVTDPQHAFRDLYDKTCRAARGLDDAAA